MLKSCKREPVFVEVYKQVYENTIKEQYYHFCFASSFMISSVHKSNKLFDFFHHRLLAGLSRLWQRSFAPFVWLSVVPGIYVPVNYVYVVGLYQSKKLNFHGPSRLLAVKRRLVTRSYLGPTPWDIRCSSLFWFLLQVLGSVVGYIQKSPGLGVDQPVVLNPNIFRTVNDQSRLVIDSSYPLAA